MLPLTLKRMEHKPLKTPIYVKADKLKQALADQRVYLVEGAAERKKHPKEKLFNGTTFNHEELKRRIADKVQDKAKFAKEWKWAPQDADQFSGIFTGWAKTMGADATKFLERTHEELANKILPAGLSHDPNDPYRNIDLKSEAQLMRWAAGAGLETNFQPFQGNLFDQRDKDWASRIKRAAQSAQFGIKANAQASFAVGEARVKTLLYLPHYSGWHVSPEVLGEDFDLGHFRLQGDMTLYAVAGASLALNADAALLLTAGKQGLKGTPRNQRGAKAKVGAKGEIDLFAGLKEGVDLSGALQWLNPEGMMDANTPKRVDPHKAIAEYADIAKVSADAAAIQGYAAKLGFEARYDGGKFRIAAKAGACLGLGGEGSVACEVGAETIGEFFMCTAHLLKQTDYRKMAEVMEERSFKAFNQMMFIVESRGRTLREFLGKEFDVIDSFYSLAIQEIQRQGREFLQQLEHRMRGWSWHAYLPPEAGGALFNAIADAREQAPDDPELRGLAAFCINELLATRQTPRHLDETLQRITYDITAKRGLNEGIRRIASIVDGTPYAGCVQRTQTLLAGAQPLLGRPFLRNDDPSFIMAKFPLHDVMYG